MKKKKKSHFEEAGFIALMEQSYKRFRLRECTKENPKSRFQESVQKDSKLCSQPTNLIGRSGQITSPLNRILELYMQKGEPIAELLSTSYQTLSAGNTE